MELLLDRNINMRIKSHAAENINNNSCNDSFPKHSTLHESIGANGALYKCMLTCSAIFQGVGCSLSGSLRAGECLWKDFSCALCGSVRLAA